jgi:hypothetical protein
MPHLQCTVVWYTSSGWCCLGHFSDVLAM